MKRAMISKKALAMLAVAAEKAIYYSQFCGCQTASVWALTANNRHRHPNGAFKGAHTSAL